MTDERLAELRQYLGNRAEDELAIVPPKMLNELLAEIERLRARVEMDHEVAKWDAALEAKRTAVRSNRPSLVRQVYGWLMGSKGKGKRQ